MSEDLLTLCSLPTWGDHGHWCFPAGAKWSFASITWLFVCRLNISKWHASATVYTPPAEGRGRGLRTPIALWVTTRHPPPTTPKTNRYRWWGAWVSSGPHKILSCGLRSTYFLSEWPSQPTKIQLWESVIFFFFLCAFHLWTSCNHQSQARAR